MKRMLVVAVLIAFGAAARAGAGAAQYEVIDLRVAGDFSYATGINNDGWVVGRTRLDGDAGFLWRPGHGVVRHYASGFHAWANAINDSGDVVGFARNYWGDHAALWSWSLLDLGVLPGGSWSEAYAISNSGIIVGYSLDSSARHAVVFGGPVPHDLGANAVANDVNDAGLIVGQSNEHAVTWFDSVLTHLSEPPGSIRSAALGVNAGGAIVGYWEDAEGTHAALWEDSTSPSAPLPLTGAAVDINDLGQIVGGSQLWNPDGSITDLPGTATAINNAGWIAGHAGSAAVVFRPVPEPPTLVLALLCGLGLARCGRRRARTS